MLDVAKSIQNAMFALEYAIQKAASCLEFDTIALDKKDYRSQKSRGYIKQCLMFDVSG